MSDNGDERIIRPNHPFSKMARAATRQEVVNASVNSSQAAYDLMAKEHDRVMDLFMTEEFEPLKREFEEFRERAARRIREIERQSFSYIVISRVRFDLLRFKLWYVGLIHPAPKLEDMAEAIQGQQAAVEMELVDHGLTLECIPREAMPSDTGSFEKPIERDAHCDTCDRPELCDIILPGTGPCGRNRGAPKKAEG